MSQRFHINPVTGQPGPCSAQKACPFGGADEHFDSMEEARENYEVVMAGMTLPEPTARDEVRERLIAEAEKATLREQQQLAPEQESSLRTILEGTPDGALDLPQNPRGERSDPIREKLLLGDVAAAQESLREWISSIDRDELSDGWREALTRREKVAEEFLAADPVAVEAYLSKHYLRPHATNGSEVRGTIVPKADGWAVDGHELVHESGMKLTMTPGYASYSGWSIGGPEGWRDNYFKTSSGLYPVSDYDLRDKRVLDRVASYAPAA